MLHPLWSRTTAAGGRPTSAHAERERGEGGGGERLPLAMHITTITTCQELGLALLHHIIEHTHYHHRHMT